MDYGKHVFPIILILVAGFLVTAAEPYVGNNIPELAEGFEDEIIARGFGGPTCLEWYDSETLLVCDRDEGRILKFDKDFEYTVILDGLNHPHGLHITQDYIVVSQQGELERWNRVGWDFTNKTTLVDNVPTGNHQPNAVNALENGTLLWHVGSTCNVCEEADERNAAILWVDIETSEHGIYVSGARNSFDGVLTPAGYFWTDNGRDWNGDHPPEEINILIEGANYGWPNDEPETPVPEGTIGPVATWIPHSSVNGIDYRRANSSLPGLDPSETQVTLYATVYGSWNAIIPVGHEIIQIDLKLNETTQEWESETTSFAQDLGTPLPIAIHPDSGEIYYATFGQNGQLRHIS